MGMFGKLLGSAIDVVLTPVEIVKDVASLGGALDGEEETYTGKRLRKAAKKISDAADDAGDGDFL